MGMILHSVFMLLGVLTGVVLVQTQEQSDSVIKNLKSQLKLHYYSYNVLKKNINQVFVVFHLSGFTSIDCGLPEDAAYTEESTGINYVSDAEFISTGVSKSVSPEDKRTNQKQFDYLRSFPSGVRNCYRINVTSGARYLIRASFLYGNYDGLNELPQFDLHLGVNLWDTVKFTNASLSINNELIHSPSLDYIQLCLINTGNGIPFISTIELRTLYNNTYVTNPAASLARLLRLDCGSITNRTYRYKDDLYDRLWEPSSDDQWTQLSSALSNDYPPDTYGYRPPAVVMNTAVTPINAGASLDFKWESDNTENQYYFYMYFTELVANETRSFNINLNGQHWQTVTPTYRVINTQYPPTTPWYGGYKYQISLVRTESSTLPPIISALEVYLVKGFSQLETEKNDVDAITNIKIAYRVTRNWQGDPCAPREYKWNGLDCRVDGTPRIISLDLSSNRLTGYISPYIFELTMLESLDLSNNSLNGPIPYFLAELQSLKFLNLANNNLTGSVPTELVQRSNDGILSLRLGQNPNLCESATCNQMNQQTNDKGNKNSLAVRILASIAGILALLLIVVAGAAIIYALKKRKLLAAVMELNNPNERQLGSKQRQYSFNELVKITNNFDRILGRGGFGTVYHGFLDHTQVAVKMLSPSSIQGYQQFLAEVKLLMRIHHRNLTSLIGYCNEETRIGLIYEYMANGNLDEHLSGRKIRAKFFTWEDRLQIAMDVAQGLEYLHSGCKPPIIHRDVKCTNILLNENFQAKLADLGLSKSFPIDGETHVSTIVAGTPGYLDPEYEISNKLTEKSDVYSFGVVLLKIITGQPALLKMHEKTHVSQWVSSMLAKGDLKSIVEPRLQGDFDTSSAWRAIETAMACVSINSTKRPHMSHVVTELKECLAMEFARKYTGCHTQNNDSVVLLTVNLTTESGPVAR